MKRVTFEVAKALKEAGYPQDCAEYYYGYNECIQKRDNCYVNCQCVAPNYLDVWLWLWREKMIKIDIYSYINKCAIFDITQEVIYSQTFTDPENAIIAAIKYLVNYDLIK